MGSTSSRRIRAVVDLDAGIAHGSWLIGKGRPLQQREKSTWTLSPLRLEACQAIGERLETLATASNDPIPF